MKTKLRTISCLLMLVVGCKKAAQRSPAVPTTSSEAALPPASKWTPLTKGVAYQLGLKNGAFSFCDDTGPRELDLATGSQTVGTAACDPKKDAIKAGCGDQVDIVSPPDGPYDTVSVGRYSFRLHGHVRDCDRDAGLVLVSTTGEIVLMDATANKIASAEAELPDIVVLRSGWAAWNSQNKDVPLRLEKTSNLLLQAVTPHED